jgi:D-alanyl-lipoteichoic acid acyltransferase DltB (MBOAT superfamily)
LAIGAGVVLLLALFVVLKTEPLARAAAASAAHRRRAIARPGLATDLRWLGFPTWPSASSMSARPGARPSAQRHPREFVTYALFFPAFTAGPIDRVGASSKTERAPFKLDSAVLLDGGSRIVVGVLKSLCWPTARRSWPSNAANAGQTHSPLWLWVLVYAYAWRLYLDFSGYTDIAIGLGRLVGIRLPENFDRPYTRQNLTLFWNSWHITLSQWFRAYVFNPLTRALRARPLPPAVIILLTQLVVMLLIGLWHGVTVNFVIWGVWHGLGLFIHNRWAIQPRAAALDSRPRLCWPRTGSASAHLSPWPWLVWFALPAPGLASTCC